MGSSNIYRLWQAATKDPSYNALDMTSTESTVLRPKTNDTGSYHLGDGTYNMDFKWWAAAAKYVLFDVGSAIVTIEDVDVKLGDNDSLQFGDATGGDVSVVWDGSNLQITPATDDTGIIAIGNGTKDIDFKWYGGVSTSYFWLQVNPGYPRMDLVSMSLYIDDGAVALGYGDRVYFGDSSDTSLFYRSSGLNYLAGGPYTGLWASAPSEAVAEWNQKSFKFEDDFIKWTPAATEWVVTEDDAACTQAISTTAGGVLLLTNKATTDDNAQQVQWATLPFTLAANKHLWFEARVRFAARKAGADSEIDWFVGLAAIEDITGVADNLPASCVGFLCTEGANTYSFNMSKSGTHTGTVAAVGTLGTAWFTLGFFVNGITNATPYIDGTAGTAATATVPDAIPMCPLFMVRNGDATITQTMEIDYVKVVQLR